MQEYRRLYKGNRAASSSSHAVTPWIPVRKACLKLYQIPCLVVLVIFTLCYISLIIKEDDSRPEPYRLRSEPVRKVLIVSYFRSGSSFLGDLLRSNPRSFYFFEPLRFFSESRNFSQMRRFVDDLFNCRFESWDEYLSWARDRDVRAFQRNEYFWASCASRSHTAHCYNRVFISLFCKKTLFRVMKVTRLPVHELFPLLLKSPDIKVIHLVRDPRGTMHSRTQPLVALWCNRTSGCSSEQEFCSTLREDLRYSCLAQYTYPGRLFFLRYEDLACQPEEITASLLAFLEVPEVPIQVQYFLRYHTKRKFTGSHPYLTPPYTTKRDSTATAFAWQRAMSLKHIQEVQNHCSDVVQMLGFESIEGPDFERMSCSASAANSTTFLGPEEDPALSVPCAHMNLSYTSDFFDMSEIEGKT